MDKTSVDELRQRILPVLLYCQANKGDLKCKDWQAKGMQGRNSFMHTIRGYSVVSYVCLK